MSGGRLHKPPARAAYISRLHNSSRIPTALGSTRQHVGQHTGQRVAQRVGAPWHIPDASLPRYFRDLKCRATVLSTAPLRIKQSLIGRQVSLRLSKRQLIVATEGLVSDAIVTCCRNGHHSIDGPPHGLPMGCHHLCYERVSRRFPAALRDLARDNGWLLEQSETGCCLMASQ